MAVETTLLAQVVLTLRSVFSGRNDFMLIATERSRVYAVTNKNRIITLCLGIITIAQLIVGTYLTVYTARRGCESATKCHP